MEKNNSKKILAIGMVMVMMFSGIAVMFASGSDAAETDGFREFNSDDLKPIDLPEGFGDELDNPDAELLGDSRSTGVLEALYPGSWSWSTETGFGPYNSFYGAFDIDNGNAFVGVLNPYNLKQLIDGTDLSAEGHYNIMWVLPTVYWSVDNDGNLELSNDPTKGTAYAHTIDGHVYKYIAYGVYEATSDDNSNPTMLTSESGKTPIANKSLSEFRNLASTDLSDSLGSGAWQMLWNYYQMQLYRFVSLSVMDDFNSQSIVGNGPIYQSLTVTTGATDLLGPYAGQLGTSNADKASSCKLFLENTWGGKVEMADSQFKSGYIYADTNHKPVSNPTSGTPANVTKIFYTDSAFNNKFGLDISTNEDIWGLPITVTDESNPIYGTTDGVYVTLSSTNLITFGGNGSDSAYKCGINCLNVYSSVGTTSSNYYGTRIAFVFDQDPVTFTPDSYDYLLEYDSTLMATTSAAISVDGMDPITHDYPTYTIPVESNNTEYGTVDVSELTDVVWGTPIEVDGLTVTIGESTITATPADGYRLTGWSVSTGDIVQEDTVITANFAAIPAPVDPDDVLLDLIPFIVLCVIVMFAVGALMAFKGDGTDLVKLLVGLTVCIIVFAAVLLPAI